MKNKGKTACTTERRKKIIPYLTAWIIFACCTEIPLGIKAQYSLQEAGISAAAGVCLPLEYKDAKIALGWQGKIFFSHYACGKRFGIHADLGVRSSGLVLPWSASYAGLGEPVHIRMNWIDGGFYFKIRPHEYHRPVEPALLAGIKLSYSPYVTLDGKSQKSNYDIQFNRFQPGIHLSGWFKRKIGNQSLFIQPGIEYYPFHSILLSRGIIGAQISGMYIFLGAGYSLWNSKHKKISKG